MIITFRKLTDNDYSLLHKWCSKKNVYEWFEQRILSLEEITKKYKKKQETQELLIIQYDSIDIGFIQIYPYEEDNNYYEFDLFIGEEDYLNKGIGEQVINQIIEYMNNKYNPIGIILRPFKRNERAVHCYQKCGFKILREEESTDTLNHKETIVIMINKKEDKDES